MKARIKLFALIAAIVITLGLASRPMSAVATKSDGCVSDGTGVLSETTKEFIIERNRNLEANCRGAQISVVVMDTVCSGPIEDYAETLFEKRGIGRSEENNGVLLLMAIDDRDYYIVSGSGLASVFPTKVLSGIIRNDLEPRFREGDYDGATYAAFRKLNDAVCAYYDVDPEAIVDEASFSCGSFTCTGPSCSSCGGVLLLGCAACVGYELFS